MPKPSPHAKAALWLRTVKLACLIVTLATILCANASGKTDRSVKPTETHNGTKPVSSHLNESSVPVSDACANPELRLEDITVTEPVGSVPGVITSRWQAYVIGNITYVDAPICNLTWSADFTVTNETATSGVDYQITISTDRDRFEPVMKGKITQHWAENRLIVTFYLYSDNYFGSDPRGIDVADETFFIELSNPVGIRLLKNRMKVTIRSQASISAVQRTYTGYFLKGVNETNIFNVSVDWHGMPGRVLFQVNGNAPFELTGNASGVSHAFNMNTDFPARFSPSFIQITPRNDEGYFGTTRTEPIYVFPYPAWLDLALQSNPSALRITPQGGAIRYDFINVEFPRPHYEAVVVFPKATPIFGGDEFGITETFGKFSGTVSSNGSGSLSLSGQTGFVGLGNRVEGSMTGSGEFRLNQNGLSVINGSINPKLKARVGRYISLFSAIPRLRKLEFIPEISRFDDKNKLYAELEMSYDLALNWQQDPQTRDLVFTGGTGDIGVKLKAGMESGTLNDRIKFKGWVAGGGIMTVGAPAPTIRRVDFTFDATAQFRFDYLWEGKDFNESYTARCSWIPSTGQFNCSDTSQDNSLLLNGPFNPKLELIQTQYADFGDYESFRPAAKEASDRTKIFGPPMFALPAANATLVSNVFAGAAPVLLPVGNNGKVLLWVRQNTSLPALQSTEIAWSYYDGTNWSAPAVIRSDSQAEFSPVAGVDSNGNVVASWLRVKDPAFSSTVTTFDELPLFYKRVEVVSAVFNPVTRTWGDVTALTDDLALDTSLRLSSDAGGKLLLTWQSNPSGEFTATATAPATLKFSFWDGSAWSVPQAIATNLSNISEHAAAVRGNSAYLILPRDPDLNTADDQVLLQYSWNGTSWSQSSTFAAGDADNQTPLAAYDEKGVGQIIWRRGSDLVQATLENPTPRVIYQDSDSVALSNLRLLNDARGNLALVWPNVVKNGSSSIFAKVYDPQSSTWSEDRQLLVDQNMFRDVSGYIDIDGQLHLVYLFTTIQRTSKTVVIGGQTVTVPNIPVEGVTDLRLFDPASTIDLTIADNSLSLSPGVPAIGQAVTAQLDIKNVGNSIANNFQVSIYSGDPDSGGILIGSSRVLTPLLAGEHRVHSITFNNLTGGEIVAVVDSLNEISEVNEVNNRATAHIPQAPQTLTISGRVSEGANGLGGVVMTITSPTSFGSASGTVNTSETGNYTFANLPAGRNYTVTPAKAFYGFSPTSKSFTNLTVSQVEQNFSATSLPVLVSEESSTRAIAIDAVTWQREPFPRFSPIQWGVDRGTRVMLFALNVDLLPGENISVISATGEDVLHRRWSMPVEYVGKVSGYPWLTCVIVNLGFVSPDLGDVLVQLDVRGVRTNRVRLGIGHIGGGLPDDPGAIPTPGRQP